MRINLLLNKVPQPCNAQPAAHPWVPARVSCGGRGRGEAESFVLLPGACESQEPARLPCGKDLAGLVGEAF